MGIYIGIAFPGNSKKFQEIPRNSKKFQEIRSFSMLRFATCELAPVASDSKFQNPNFKQLQVSGCLQEFSQENRLWESQEISCEFKQFQIGTSKLEANN